MSRKLTDAETEILNELKSNANKRIRSSCWMLLLELFLIGITLIAKVHLSGFIIGCIGFTITVESLTIILTDIKCRKAIKAFYACVEASRNKDENTSEK